MAPGIPGVSSVAPSRTRTGLRGRGRTCGDTCRSEVRPRPWERSERAATRDQVFMLVLSGPGVAPDHACGWAGAGSPLPLALA